MKNDVFTIKIFPLNKTINAEKNENLFSALQKNNIPINGICGGNKVCGKCGVRILSGHIPPGLSDKTFFSQKKLNLNFRLSCAININQNLIIEIPKENIIESMEYKPETKNITVPINPIIKLRNDENIYGLALDIGTTTIVGALINLNSGKLIDEEFRLNPQKKYGMDIISRISYSMQNKTGLDDLHNILLSVINDIIRVGTLRTNIKPNDIYLITVASNSVMNHSLLNKNLESFGKYPYKPLFKKTDLIRASDIHININKDAKLFVVPNIDGFVGGDITSDIISSNFGNKDKIELLIDIGTNGEIVLNNKGNLTATSTAAGPAFEGAKIKFGMIAKTGAIDKIYIKENDIKFETIGDFQPVGICGTGLINGIASFLKLGWIDYTGRILKEYIPENRYIETENDFGIKLTDKIYISQQDIREFQLAKGAILAGITLMLKKYKLQTTDIDTMYIAGAFGKYLNLENALTLKLFPEMDVKKIKFIGNGSLQGAINILLNKDILNKSLEIVDNIEFFDIANQENFQTTYIEQSLYFQKNPSAE